MDYNANINESEIDPFSNLLKSAQDQEQRDTLIPHKSSVYKSILYEEGNGGIGNGDEGQGDGDGVDAGVSEDGGDGGDGGNGEGAEAGNADAAREVFLDRVKKIMCYLTWNLVRTLSVLKPQLPLTYMGPHRFFFNWKILVMSLIVVVLFVVQTESGFSKYGSVT